MTTAIARDPRRVTHADSVDSCRHYLKVLGAWELKVWGGPMQRKGIPDILACWRGRMIAVECKVARDKLRPEQAKERAAILAAGGIYVLAREDGALAVQRALQEAGLDPPGLLV